jgi:nicotinamidase-related amidase
MNGEPLKRLLVLVCGLAAATSLIQVAVPAPAFAQTIVDEWCTVKAPPAPELKPVMIDPKVTALLILDIQKQNCNLERRPRCVASVPKIQRLLTQARDKGVAVIYSLVFGGSVADILPEVAPQGGEPMVMSGPDKFLGTDLEKLLKDKGVQALIIVGTVANGIGVYTAGEAALRGFKVVVPVDGISATDPYAEQYTAWHLVNAPLVGPQVTLTRMDMIQYP